MATGFAIAVSCILAGCSAAPDKAPASGDGAKASGPTGVSPENAGKAQPSAVPSQRGK